MLFVNKKSFIADIVFWKSFVICFLNEHVTWCNKMICIILMIGDAVFKAGSSRLSAFYLIRVCFTLYSHFVREAFGKALPFVYCLSSVCLLFQYRRGIGWV